MAAKITKWSRAFKGSASSYNFELFNIELQVKGT